MKTFIKIKTQFEGFHRWKDAPDSVAFLRHLHRHIFNVSVKIKVEKYDREIEYFLALKELNRIVVQLSSDMSGEESCEMLALEIHKKMFEVYEKELEVEVGEDGENCSIVSNIS